MIKVHIQAVCEFCDGGAYVPTGPDIDYKGEPFLHHQPCTYCHGNGYRDKWVTLDTFIEMFTSIALEDLMESDWLELAQAKVARQYQDSRGGAGIQCTTPNRQFKGILLDLRALTFRNISSCSFLRSTDSQYTNLLASVDI